MLYDKYISNKGVIMKKISTFVLALLVSFSLLSSEMFASPPEHAKNNKNKKEKHNKFKDDKVKQKTLPYGLQKKLQRTGQLPPGWQKKIRAGEVVSGNVLNNGVILRPPYWETHPYSRNSDIYEVQDKIFRVNRATQEILDVFK